MRKYEFTGETKVFLNKTLHRIRAVVDFGTVHAGDVGGWIEKEEDLNHCGDAWIYGDACVYGDAKVYGNAKVYGDAWVGGNAEVYGNACVYGDAWVGGNAEVGGDTWVGGDAKVYGNACVYGDTWVGGDAKVYGNAKVYGDARVYGDAKVYGNACVYGDACVGGNAEVYGNAKVGGDAKVYGGKWEKSPCFIQGTRWSINISSPNTVRCGCQDHRWEEWHNHYAEISRRHNGDDVLDEYIQYFNLLCGLYGHEDCAIVREGGKI